MPDMSAQALLQAPAQIPAKTGGGGGGGQRGRQHASPVFLLIMGVFVLLIGISTSLFDIQATEALVSGVKSATFVPNWQTLGQPFALISGQSMPSNIASGYYTGWIVEFISIILVVCFDLALEAIIHAPRWVVEAFKVSMYVIAATDVITNYMYVPGVTSWIVRAIVAVLIAVSSFFFPIIGVLMLEKAIKGW